MNILRCTLPPSRSLKPSDAEAARYFLAALDRTYELYEQTGRRLPVGNFANILLAIIAPAARRLMCDISPCGGGRCFFALAPNGGMFPCSEFIGLDHFQSGNLLQTIFPPYSNPSHSVWSLIVRSKISSHADIAQSGTSAEPPCPAEAFEMNGGMNKTGAFCEFYEEQVRYAFRVIADGKVDAYLWDGWDKGMKTTFNINKD